MKENSTTANRSHFEVYAVRKHVDNCGHAIVLVIYNVIICNLHCTLRFACFSESSTNVSFTQVLQDVPRNGVLHLVSGEIDARGHEGHINSPLQCVSWPLMLRQCTCTFYDKAGQSPGFGTGRT